MKLSTGLKSIVSFIPLYKIFVEPSPRGKTTFDALTYDWLQLEQTLKSINKYQRRKIWDIASAEGAATLDHNYKNIKFWGCVENASR